MKNIRTGISNKLSEIVLTCVMNQTDKKICMLNHPLFISGVLYITIKGRDEKALRKCKTRQDKIRKVNTSQWGQSKLDC